MLIDSYLPAYQFHEVDFKRVYTDRATAYHTVLHCDFRSSWLIKLLFRVRGTSTKATTIGDITRLGFVKLGEIPNEEIVYGMVTTSPIFNSCKAITGSDNFINIRSPEFIKAVINFRVYSTQSLVQIISTETRV